MTKEIIKKLKNVIPFEITEKEIISLSLDISRTSDSKITKYINSFKIQNNLKLNSIQKNKIRDYIIGRTDKWEINGVSPIKKNIIEKEDIVASLNILYKGIKQNDKNVLGTMKSRLNKKDNKKEYEKIIKNLEINKSQLIIFHIKRSDNLNSELIKSNILSIYNDLSNYHYLAIFFDDIDWDTIADISVYCENFRAEEHFNVFEKQKENKINELNNFLKTNNNIIFNDDLSSGVSNFYKNLSYGFQFNDLFISSTSKTKILILQKIELDENIYPCPDCLETNVRGNSYPKLLQKSFECQNPNCPSRSKIGRGKRYDFLGVKRGLKLNDKENIVKLDFAKKFRRDIFDGNDCIEMLIRFYSWKGDNVLIISNSVLANNINNRVIKYQTPDYELKHINQCPIYSFIELISKNIKLKREKEKNFSEESLFYLANGDSSSILSNIKHTITGAITSPPYYNAREYSQWPTFICYLIDMMINALSVYNKLENGSFYFYNIGDIVGQDNVYVSSHMSKRRLMLGFYSVLIFKKVGFKLIENVIWDKGEVQSKRNSTENLFPGYIKPINCYEHIFVFVKGDKKIDLKTKILKLDSVKKINSKGENKLGHTAPYPEGLVDFIFSHINTRGYILDPFLGSGTTVISGIKNKIKTIGIELNEDYYKLSLKRIKEVHKE